MANLSTVSLPTEYRGVETLPSTVKSSSKSTSAPKVSLSSAVTANFDLEKDAKKKKKEAEALLKKQKKEARKGISKSFDPIFKELDRQLGALPGRKAEYEGQLNSLAEGQSADVEAERVKNVNALESSKGTVETQSKSSMRELEEDVRNQLKAKANYFGALGSDSSAVGQASEAVTKAGLKSKASILSVRDQALNEIGGKITDINTLAGEQDRKVDEWKRTKLFELGQTFNDKLDSLNAERANADATKERAIDDMIKGLNSQFVGRLQQLDDAVTNYKTSINTWAMQRQADLEDYATKLGLSSAYNTSGTADKFRYFTDNFGNQIRLNETTGQSETVYKGDITPEQKLKNKQAELELSKLENPDEPWYGSLADALGF